VRDVEKPLGNYVPPTEVPDLDNVRSTIVLPDIPCDVPAVRAMLRRFVEEPLDPWTIDLSMKPQKADRS
jgi:hypothetical protein